MKLSDFKIFCVVAFVINQLQPAFADYDEKYLKRARISPDCKFVACAFQATACHDALDPPDRQFKHQVQALFDIKNRKWKILDHMVQQGPFPSDCTGQFLDVIAFSPDGKYLATSSAKTELSLVQRLVNSPFVFPDVHITISVWDIDQQKLVNKLSDMHNPGCMSSSGLIIDMPKYELPNLFSLIAASETKIGLWNFLSGKHQLDFAPAVESIAQGGDQIFPDPCSFSPDNSMLQAVVHHLTGAQRPGRDSYLVRLFDTHSGKVIKNLPVKSSHQAFSKDGKILFACDTGISAWDISSGKQIWQQELNGTGSSERDSICTGGNRVLIYYELHQEITMKDGRKGILHDGTHGLRVYEGTTGKLIRDFGTFRDYTRELLLTPDGKNILVFSGKGPAPKLETIDVDSGKTVSSIEFPVAEVVSILERESLDLSCLP